MTQPCKIRCGPRRDEHWRPRSEDETKRDLLPKGKLPRLCSIATRIPTPAPSTAQLSPCKHDTATPDAPQLGVRRHFDLFLIACSSTELIMAATSNSTTDRKEPATIQTGDHFPSDPTQLQESTTPARTPDITRPTTPGSSLPVSARGKSRTLYISILLDGDADLVSRCSRVVETSLESGANSKGGEDAR